MIFKIVLLYAVFAFLAPPEIGALKRIKRNSSLDPKNSRIKQDFVALQTDLLETPNNSGLKDPPFSLNTSNTHGFESTKKRNISSRPLAVILRERERKLNDNQVKDHAAVEASHSESKIVNLAEENDPSKLSKASGSAKESHKTFNAKYLPHMLHTSSLVGTHVIRPSRPIQPSLEVLKPFDSFDQLMKFGNMMMFKVGVDSLPYSPQLQEQGNFLQQTNEPDFDYIEGPQDEAFNENARLKSSIPNNIHEKGVIITNPIKIIKSSVSDNEPKDLVNLMQTALDTLIYNSNKNDYDNEFKCPLHLEKKSLQNAGGNDGNADVIQVCSCRFIKRDKEQK